MVHIHNTTRTSASTEADVAKLNLSHKCEACACEFTKLRGLKMHMARWCDVGRTRNFFPINAPGMVRFQLLNLGGLGYGLELRFGVVIAIIVSLTLTITLITTVTIM